MALKPTPEDLEDRQLLSASLAPLGNLTVPAQLGYQLPIDGSGDLDPSQTYTVTSDNPHVQVSVAQGQFWTLNIQHTASSTPGDISFSGPITFQLFQDLTPQTVAKITQFTNDGYYNGKDFTRIASGFPNPTDYVAQGGAPNPDGTGASGQAGTPFADEFLQQLAFTGTGQLAMANAGPNTNDAQFFVTTGTPTSLDFNYTIFGQVVSGSNILAEMTQVATEPNPVEGENSLPINPIVITSATLSSTNVNGVIHIDTTSARMGDSANIMVTATDPVNGTHVSQTFKLTTSAYNGPTTPPINFKPFANPVTTTTGEDDAITIQLSGMSGYPGGNQPISSYSLVTTPSHGELTQFNALLGTVVYTPDPGFSGVDSFQFAFQATKATKVPTTSPDIAFSNPASVTITVAPLPPPLVTVSDVSEVFNKQHDVTEILVHFSGPVNSTLAVNSDTYRLALPDAKGSYSAGNAHVIKLRKRVYDSSNFTVTLKLQTPVALKKRAELLIFGQPPSGLTDSLGRFIDGDRNGTPGRNATAFLKRSGVTLT